jgi:hypothetical protein
MKRRRNVMKSTWLAARRIVLTTAGQGCRRFFSTMYSSRRRLSRTLYRQLLQWCKRTDPSIPLQFFIPTVRLTSPIQVNLDVVDAAPEQRPKINMPPHCRCYDVVDSNPGSSSYEPYFVSTPHHQQQLYHRKRFKRPAQVSPLPH